MIVISFNDNDLSDHLKGTADRINNNIGLWNSIGQKAHRYMAVDHFNKMENKDGSSWKPTWRKNGRDYTSRPYGRGGTKMLVDSGMMRGQIYWTAGQNEVKMISPASYSVYHNSDAPRTKLPKRQFMFLKDDEIGNIVTYMIREIFRR